MRGQLGNVHVLVDRVVVEVEADLVAVERDGAFEVLTGSSTAGSSPWGQSGPAALRVRAEGPVQSAGCEPSRHAPRSPPRPSPDPTPARWSGSRQRVPSRADRDLSGSSSRPRRRPRGCAVLAPVGSRVVWASGSGGTVIRSVDGSSTVVRGPRGGPRHCSSATSRPAAPTTPSSCRSARARTLRVYATADGGRTWSESFRNPDPAAFYDCMAFVQDRRLRDVRPGRRGLPHHPHRGRRPHVGGHGQRRYAARPRR